MLFTEKYRVIMAIYPIVYLPNPCLRKVAATVDVFNDELQTLINDMFETMYEAKGVGLAAPQIGVSKQISVIDVVGDKKDQLVIINPKIIHREGEKEYIEGCLSVPGPYEKVIRAEKVTVSALDRNGKPFEINADGLLGECLQHEIDHLNGKLYIDLLSPLKRKMARRKMDKHLRMKAKNND